MLERRHQEVHMHDVIVGVDLARPHDDSLLWAAEYCRITGQELVASVGFEPTEAELPPQWYEQQMAATRARVGAVVAVAAGVPFRVDVRYGDPRVVIPVVAAESMATTVVVGAHGAGGFHHLGLGTVAHHLARHLPIPMVIVPRSSGPLEGGTVVVGLDGSPGDITTANWARELTKAVRGRLSVVYASDPTSHSYPHPFGATIADQAELAVRDEVAEWATGHDVVTTIEVDEPVDALVHVADNEDAAVVVVGRTHVGHLNTLLLGRGLAELPFEAGRPVAIVPRAAS
jgi:nucleotide-binding universal stress UspA family protein